MNEIETYSVPVYEVILPPKTKFEKERRAFRRLLPQLLPTLRGKYALIHEEQVVDTGDDRLSLALRFFATHESVPIYIGLVAEQREVFRMPSIRNVPTED